MKFSPTLSDADIARFTVIAVTNHTWVTPTLTTFHKIIEQMTDLHVVLAICGIAPNLNRILAG